MTRWFCDRCKKELPIGSPDHDRLKVRRGRFKVEVTIAVDGVWNNGLICHDCVRAIVVESVSDPVLDAPAARASGVP